MIYVQTYLDVQDNSGAKKVQCIKVFKGSKASIGDVILVSIKQMRIFSSLKKIKIQKGKIMKALIIRTKYNTLNTIGHYLKFNENSVILLNAKDQPIGTRILGPITLILRKKKRFKLISLSTNFI